MIKKQQSNKLDRVIRALSDAGADVYEVGGPVRDELMDREAKDHDYLVRHLTVRQIQNLLEPFGTVTLIGRSFGVIKFTPHGERSATVDIALPRKEMSTGEGHRDFEVDFDPELTVEEDLGRRDFTINAMARDLKNSKLVDPHGGQKDLKKRLLRQVFPNAFKEDPLRLMRAVQFAARLNLNIEDQTWEAMREHARLIKTVSKERIAEEIGKLMTAAKPSRGFEIMRDCGLLTHVLPELEAIIGIDQDKQPGEDVFDHTMRVLDATRGDPAIKHSGNLDLMFAALLHDIGKSKTKRYHEPSERVVFFGHQIASKRMARGWLEHNKISTLGVNADTVCKLIEHHMFETKAYFTDKAIRRFIAKVSPELIFMLMDLRLADNRGGKHPTGIKGVQKLTKRIKAEMDRKPPFGPKDLEIGGHDLMALGFSEGPQIGQALSSLVQLVLDNPELNTKEQLLALAKNMREDLG
jgi:tRNA nucleotidyltransferase (CCA-adding enzyme)